MSWTAALSWADFDDEADAPSFDVLGDLATATDCARRGLVPGEAANLLRVP